LLQPLAGRWHASAQALFDLALGRRVPSDLAGSLHRLQRVVALNLTHQHFLAPVVIAVANDLAVEPDAID